MMITVKHYFESIIPEFCCHISFYEEKRYESERDTRLGDVCTSGTRDRHVRIWRDPRGMEGRDAEGCRHLHGVHWHWLNRI